MFDVLSSWEHPPLDWQASADGEDLHPVYSRVDKKPRARHGGRLTLDEINEELLSHAKNHCNVHQFNQLCSNRERR